MTATIQTVTSPVTHVDFVIPDDCSIAGILGADMRVSTGCDLVARFSFDGSTFMLAADDYNAYVNGSYTINLTSLPLVKNCAPHILPTQFAYQLGLGSGSVRPGVHGDGMAHDGNIWHRTMVSGQGKAQARIKIVRVLPTTGQITQGVFTTVFA